MSDRWTVVEASTIYVDLPGPEHLLRISELPGVAGEFRCEPFEARHITARGKYRVRMIVERDDDAEPEKERIR